MFPRPGAQAPGSEVTQPTRGWCSHLPSRRQRVGGYAAHPTASGKLTPMISRQCFPPPDARAPGGGYAAHRADGVSSHSRIAGGGYAAHPTELTRVFSRQCFPPPDAQHRGGVTQPTGQMVFPATPAVSGRRLRSPSEPGQCFQPLPQLAGGGYAACPAVGVPNTRRANAKWRLRNPTGCSGKHTPILSIAGNRAEGT